MKNETVGNRAVVPGFMRFFLAIPLTGKIAGANALIGVAALVAFTAIARSGADAGSMSRLFIIALAAALVINLILVTVALRPLKAIEDTARLVSLGDLGARVPSSALADRNIERVGTTLNALLDVLSEDQNRIRKLAGRALTANDEERAATARALHDSAAQSLAALAFQVSAVTSETQDPVLKARFDSLRQLAVEILDEVRLMGQTLYPQALENLGLAHALKGLTDEIAERRPDVRLQVEVDDANATSRVPLGIASLLYHAAREGLSNALQHGNARAIDVKMSVEDDRAHLTVADDGRGFDVSAAERQTEGMGLFGIRQRLALVGGDMKISSRAGAGTRLSVTVPLTATGVVQQ